MFTSIYLALALAPTPILMERPPLQERQAGASHAFHSELGAKLEAFRQEIGFPGAVFGYALPDGTSGAVAVGFADPATNAPMKATHRMLAGSVGKTFFAAWALQLVEEAKIDLDAPLSKYLGSEPWFGRLPNANALTLRNLLRHQSGITEQVYNAGFVKELREKPDKSWKPEELIALAFDAKPAFEAGKGFSYADTNYIIAMHAIEKATGRNAYREIERRFLKPLKLTRTVPSDRRELPDLAAGKAISGAQFTGGERTIVDGKFVINPQMEWAGGGFLSNAEDLARWARALFGGNVLKPETKAIQSDGVPATTGPGEKYGIGVQIRPVSGGNGLGHGGFFPGYLTEMEYLPSGIGVAIQYNADGPRALLQNRHKILLELAKIIEDSLNSGTPAAAASSNS